MSGEEREAEATDRLRQDDPTRPAPSVLPDLRIGRGGRNLDRVPAVR